MQDSEIDCHNEMDGLRGQVKVLENRIGVLKLALEVIADTKSDHPQCQALCWLAAHAINHTKDAPSQP